MSKIFKKITGSKVSITVKIDSIEVMGQAVADKDMFCIHWGMKGLRGRENTGETDNVRAAIAEGSTYAVARFTDVLAGYVHGRPRKDGSGYEASEIELRVVSPALHKKEDKVLGRALVNIFEKVPALAAGQPAHQAEQTVSLSKDGNAVAHIKMTLALKSDAPVEEEGEQPTSPVEQQPEGAGLVVKTPPASPQKEAGSEGGSTGASEIKEETTSKSRHRKRHSSNNASMMAAQLKRKEEEVKQKDDELKAKDDELKKKDEELKKKDEEFAEKEKQAEVKLRASNCEVQNLREHNSFLESRVKELEQANEKTDVVPLDANQERMQDDIMRLTEDKERLTDEKMKLAEELDEARREIAQLKAGCADGEKKELELLNQQLTALQEELAKAKKDISASPEGAAPAAAAAPAGNGLIMQAIFGAIGAVLGIIIGHFI